MAGNNLLFKKHFVRRRINILFEGFSYFFRGDYYDDENICLKLQPRFH